jgi:putative phosphoribosyl transferase
MESGDRRFRDRLDAGGQLAAKLSAHAHRPDVLVLGLPRGGVPVAYEVARALDVPLDILVVRKLGVPGEEELAMGAIAAGGGRVLNCDVVQVLGLSDDVITAATAREQRELMRREHLYRRDRPPPDLRGRTVILVDDGIATGATMRAAIAAVRQQGPAGVVVATPVAAATTCEDLLAEGNEVVAVQTPGVLFAIGLWYEEFAQTTDSEIQMVLDRAWRSQAARQHTVPDTHP